jgi:hypothetical protein
MRHAKIALIETQLLFTVSRQARNMELHSRWAFCLASGHAGESLQCRAPMARSSAGQPLPSRTYRTSYDRASYDGFREELNPSDGLSACWSVKKTSGRALPEVLEVYIR